MHYLIPDISKYVIAVGQAVMALAVIGGPVIALLLLVTVII